MKAPCPCQVRGYVNLMCYNIDRIRTFPMTPIEKLSFMLSTVSEMQFENVFSAIDWRGFLSSVKFRHPPRPRKLSGPSASRLF